VAEHQKQEATVAGLVAAALGRGQQPFHLDSGQVFALAVPAARLGRRVSPAAPVAAAGASIPPPGSAPVFLNFRPFIILSRVPAVERPGNPYKRGRGLLHYRQLATFCRGFT
jgi:hypothetical protein